jgi:hypothetical protein
MRLLYFLFLAQTVVSCQDTGTTPAVQYPAGSGPIGYQVNGARTIVSAFWGYGDRWMDVTHTVRHYAYAHLPLQVTNETFGRDPYVGKGKQLRVTYLGSNGGTYDRYFGERSTAYF